MTTLSDLLSRLDPDPLRRGKQFECICQWFLRNDPVYERELRRVWLWDEWPGRWGRDAGIDLVAEDRHGDLWAIQAKAYDPGYRITKHDVDTFLAESGRPEFSFRLLIATTNLIGPTAKRTIEAQEKQASVVLLGDLDAAEVDWPGSPSDLRARRLPPKRPRPHQREAMNAAVKGFNGFDRGQLIMACGTGKTLAALFITEKLFAARTLVLVPSLSLLAQTLREWTANTKLEFDFLPVCSDETVAESDAIVANTSDLGFPVTTNPEEIATFLRRRSGPRVVFATYQSSPRIATAFGLGGVPSFDLVIADEAHRCAGRVSSDFGTILNAEAIRARRRLFMTATPRYFTGRVVREAKEADFEIASMDDEATFGPVFHRLGFAEAIERDLLTDYQVVVVGVDNATYRDWAQRGRFVTLDGTEVTDARTLAGQIGLAKAMRRYDLHRTITFHSRVRSARKFARELPEVIAWMPARQRPKGHLWSDYASGEMPAGKRHVLLQHLGRVDHGERGLLANARCLAEGVDVPTLDSVAFIDPRRSEVDIVQAVGRSIRLATDKTVGTIIIPVFIDTDENPEIALDSSSFKPVWDVIKALRSHDDELGEQLDNLRRQLGRRGKRPRLPDKIHFDLPVRVDVDFARAFDVRLIEQTTVSWEFWFGVLEQFVERHGHAHVLQRCTIDGYRLGAWVSKQRARYSERTLDADRERRLQALPGWRWEPKADQWEQGFNRLLDYVERHGDARVPLSGTVDGYQLGRWVIKQRAKHAQGTLDADREQRLRNLPGWTWNTIAEKWEAGFCRLVDYVDRHGDARVPASHNVDGYQLGAWVGHQRGMHVKGALDADHERRLQALSGWTWDPYVDKWEAGFCRLVDYVDRHGDARVPASHTVDGYQLGAWVAIQRGSHAKGTLEADRERRLQALSGWTWDAIADQWEEGYSRLVDYVQRHGHARVPQTYTVDDYQLGAWVNSQRTRYNQQRLEPDRTERLAGLPGWVWKASEAKWDEGFQHLRKFAEAHGNVRVPMDYEVDGFKLRDWLVNNRAKFDKLSPDRQRRLKSLPGWDEYSHDAKWEAGFQRLLDYVDEHGDAKVERPYVVNGYPLGSWAGTQRQQFKNGILAPDRAERLAKLPGWQWEPHAGRWEEGLHHLVEYIKRNGGGLPSLDYADEDGYRLGAWVHLQRYRSRKGELDPDRWKRLNKLKGWEWNPHADKWEEGFRRLAAYVKANGYALPQSTYVESDGYRVGAWTAQQRSLGNRGKLASDRWKRLNKLKGWDWNPPRGGSAGRK